MAEPPSHVPADSVTNYYAPTDAYVHNASIMDGHDASFDAVWPPFASDRMDLAQDGDYWPPADSQIASSNNTSGPYYRHSFDQRPGFADASTFNSLNRTGIDTSSAHQTPAPANPAFRSQPSQVSGQDGHAGTIAPNVLQATNPTQGSAMQNRAPVQQVRHGALLIREKADIDKTTNTTLPPAPPTSARIQHGQLLPMTEATVSQGRFFMSSTDDLKKVIRLQSLNPFVDIGQDPVAEITRTTIPTYNPRNSRNEIKALLAKDSKLSASISTKTSKKLGALARRPLKLDAAGQFTSGQISQSASESSSDESDYESSEDEDETAPLPPRRPDTYSGATEYDAIKALWRPRSKSLPVSEIREGLKSFWEVVQSIREHWNTDRAAVKTAEDAKKISELPMLKERVATQRGMLQIALSTAVKHGHPDIVKHFGENIAMMGAFAVFLQDRSKDSDYNGPFSRAILELLVHCTTLTDGNLEKSNVGKMLPRFVKRGDASIKALAKKISANATLATKKKAEAGKAAASSANQTKDAKVAENGTSKQVPQVAGVKRERAGDASNTQPLKKVAAETSTTNLTGKNTVTKASSASAPAVASTATATATKPKTNTVAPKPSGFFSLQSASKRPGTSIASQANTATASLPTTNVPPKKSVPAPSDGPPQEVKSFSSVFSYMEDTKKLDPKPAAKVEERRPHETAEQRKKREKKEQRRLLRVHWKPESDLVQVRLFSHDPDEELGHDASQVRDVGDTGSEGAMFKMQHRHEGDMDDDDEDEEAEAEAAKLFGREYSALSQVDFANLQEQEPEQYTMLFGPYGGGLKQPDSPESKVQEKRETDVLAVYYNKENLSPPPSPNEPSEDVVPREGEPHAFGQVPEHVLSRLAAFERPAQPAEFDLAALLGSIGGQVSQTKPAQASTVSALDQALLQLRNGSQPAPTLQQAPQSADLAAILGPLSGQQSQPQHHAPAAPALPSDLAAMLQGLRATPQVAPIPGMPTLNDFMAQGGFPMLSMGGAQSGGAQPAAQPGGSSYPYENEERKRWREQQASMGGYDGANDDYDDDQHANKRPKWNKGNDHRGGKPPPKFVVECKYFQEGKCRKGKDCTFLHNGIPAEDL